MTMVNYLVVSARSTPIVVALPVGMTSFVENYHHRTDFSSNITQDMEPTRMDHSGKGLHALSVELLAEILSYLNHYDLLRCRLVCITATRTSWYSGRG